MKFLLLSLATAVAAYCADINPRALNLIGPNTRTVNGVDVEKLRQSSLAMLFPDSRTVRQTIDIQSAADDGGIRSVSILIGATGDAVEPDLRQLEANTFVSAFHSNDVASLWARDDIHPSPLAYRVQQLAGAYDAWFLADHPLRLMDAGIRGGPPLKYWQELIDMVEEVSGGVRYGSSIDYRIQLVTRSSDDARLLAALMRWVPGVIQAMSSSSPSRSW